MRLHAGKRGWKVERRKEAQEGKEESEIDSTTLKKSGVCIKSNQLFPGLLDSHI